MLEGVRDFPWATSCEHLGIHETGEPLTADAAIRDFDDLVLGLLGAVNDGIPGLEFLSVFYFRLFGWLGFGFV